MATKHLKNSSAVTFVAVEIGNHPEEKESVPRRKGVRSQDSLICRDVSD
jgi:hypothetical protein